MNNDEVYSNMDVYKYSDYGYYNLYQDSDSDD